MLNITIHNQHSGLELISPVCFNVDTTYHVPPSQQIDAGDTMMTRFRVCSKKRGFKGALLYKLQRKYAIETDNQPDDSIASIKDTATSIYLLAFLGTGYYNHSFRVGLIECTGDFTWDEDKLWALHEKYNGLFHFDYKDNVITWLMRQHSDDDAI
jgi:hypothetical protein